MAVVREVERGLGRGFQAIVRKHGHSLSRVHSTKAAAKSWAGRVEAAIDTAGPDAPFDRTAWLPARRQESAPALDDSCPHGGWTLDRALEKWADEVAAKGTSARQLLHRVKQWRARTLARKRLDEVTLDDVQAHVDARVEAGASGSTVRQDVMTLRAVYRDAVKLWKVAGLLQPCDGVELPSPAPHRERRLEDGQGDMGGEEERLRVELAQHRHGTELLDLLDLALETGMRRGELLGLRAGEVQKAGGIWRIVKVKHKTARRGHVRRIVLSPTAARIVTRRAEGKSEDARLFGVTDAELRGAWDDARTAAGVTGLRWHDLRHEALSRMAAKGLTIGELQAQSGHRTAGILLRYVNARAQDIAGKLG